MAKRTKKEIALDVQRVKEAAVTARSIAEIATITGLSKYQVQKTLEGHPIIQKRVKSQLEKNNAVKDKTIVNNESEATTVEIQTKETSATATVPDSTKAQKKYVIDASVSGTENILNKLKNIIASNHKIVITSVTIFELEKLQNGTDANAKIDARKILAMAAEDCEHFESVFIDRSCGSPDDCIINYCKEHKDDIILLTADKTMSLKARMFSIEVEYLKHLPKTHKEHCNKQMSSLVPEERVSTPHVAKPIAIQPMPAFHKKEYARPFQAHKATIVKTPEIVPAEATTPKIQHFGAEPKKNNANSNVLPFAKMVNNKLRIEEFHTNTTSIRVLSYGQEYNFGNYELRVGDNVLIAAKIGKAIDFKVYRVISLSADNNCKLIFSKIIHNPKHISVPNHMYKAFLSMFKVRHQL